MSVNIVPFDFNSNTVRTTEIEGEVWFCAKDICDVLEIKNVSDACKKLRDTEQTTIALTDSGSNYSHQALFVSESGMYKLILRSRKPQAEAFADWVTSEVLVSIRKTGKYEAPEAKPEPEARQLPPAMSLKDYMEVSAAFGLLNDPMLKPLFQQRLAEELGGKTIAPNADRIVIATVRATELGICQKLIGTGSQLGKYLVALGLPNEGKVPHGRYMSNAYKLTTELDAAILDYFQGAIVAA